MKRPVRKLLAVLLSLVLVCSLACLSGCSLLLSSLENVSKVEESPAPGGPGGTGTPGGGGSSDGGGEGSGGSGSGSGSGGGSGAGGDRTFTFDVGVFDEYWYDSVVDASLWRTTGTVGAYANDTLVLRGDGTYSLTKEMGANADSEARWSSDGGVSDRNFNRYTYNGTYEEDGNTVTLSPATSLAVEVDVFDMTVGYDLGSFPIDYTETDDLSQPAGTCRGELVTDFIVGPYIVSSGLGNVGQVITLGEFDHGTFEFAGAVEGSGTGAGGEGGGEGEGGSSSGTPEKAGYLFTSADNAEITFEVYPDGTYTFAWPANGVSESGTYVWDKAAQTLTITDPAGTETVAAAENGVLSFTYYFSQQSQLNQGYTGSAAELEDVLFPALYALIPAGDAACSLKLYEDGSYTCVSEAGGAGESGTYTWTGSGLVLTAPDGKTAEAEVEGNLLTVTLGGQKFVAGVAELAAVMPSVHEIFQFTPGANAEITFTLYSDSTYTFAWPANGVSESGTWAIENGAFAVTDPAGATTVAEQNGGEIAFTYVFSKQSQLNQAYTGSAGDLWKAAAEAGKAVYDFVPGSNAAITFTLYDSGVFCFAWPENGVAEYGTWTLAGSVFSVTDPAGTRTEATAEGDTLSFTYVFSKQAQLNQAYTGSLGDLQALGLGSEAGPGTLADGAEIYSFTPGSNAEITLTLANDGTYTFAWPANGVSESGTWTLAGGVFSVTDPAGTVTEAAAEGDTLSFTYVFSKQAQLNQAYTGSLAGLVQAMAENGMTSAVYDFTPGSNGEITFTLYDNGGYCFAWPANGVAEYGSWTLDGSSFAVTDPAGTVITAEADGDVVSFTYVFSKQAQLNQAYTGSLAALQGLGGTGAGSGSGSGSGAAAAEIYSFTPGANAEITLTLASDGTYTFAWPANGVSESGTWTLAGGVFSVTDPAGTVTEAAAEGDTLSFTYYFSKQSQLNQAYTGSVAELVKAMAESGMAAAVYDFTPGNNAEITFTLYNNGGYCFAWPANGVAEYGSWTWAEGSFSVTDPAGTVTTAEADGDVVSFTYAFSKQAQLNQAYTGSAAALDAAVGGN